MGICLFVHIFRDTPNDVRGGNFPFYLEFLGFSGCFYVSGRIDPQYD